MQIAADRLRRLATTILEAAGRRLRRRPRSPRAWSAPTSPATTRTA